MPTFTRELEVLSQLPIGVERYRGIAAPTLLVIGDLTPDLLTDGNAALQTVMPVARTAVLEGQTHVAQFLAPDLVAAEVRVFLREPQPVAGR
jgi:pimeloyl-ACP methyl ester carboxylesterase